MMSLSLSIETIGGPLLFSLFKKNNEQQFINQSRDLSWTISWFSFRKDLVSKWDSSEKFRKLVNQSGMFLSWGVRGKVALLGPYPSMHTSSPWGGISISDLQVRPQKPKDNCFAKVTSPEFGWDEIQTQISSSLRYPKQPLDPYNCPQGQALMKLTIFLDPLPSSEIII